MRRKRFLPGAILAILGGELVRETPGLPYGNFLGESAWRVGNNFYDATGNVLGFQNIQTTMTTSVPPAVRDIATFGFHPVYDYLVRTLPSEGMKYGQAAHEMYISYLANQMGLALGAGGALALGVALLYTEFKNRQKQY